MIVKLPQCPARSDSRETRAQAGVAPAQERPARLAFVDLASDGDDAQRRFRRVFARADLEVALSPIDVKRPEALGALQLDGLVVTGGGSEGLDFAAVPLWAGLTEIFDTASARGVPGLFLGWAALAVLFHRHGIRPSPLAAPVAGVVEQEVLAPSSPYLAGVGRRLRVPVDRRAKVRWAALNDCRGLRALATAPRTGISMIEEPASRSLMLFDHLELEAGAENAAGLLFRNWLGEAVRHCRAAA